LKASEVRILVRLMYSDLTHLRRTRQARQRGKGLLIGTGQVLSWAARHSLRGVYYALFRRGVPAGAEA
jgi:hypothetical protein